MAYNYFHFVVTVTSAVTGLPLEAIGRGYLQWALANPMHFEVINCRTLIVFEASDNRRTQNAAIRQRMFELLTQARERASSSKVSI
jgi:hypothetical protein